MDGKNSADDTNSNTIKENGNNINNTYPEEQKNYKFEHKDNHPDKDRHKDCDRNKDHNSPNKDSSYEDTDSSPNSSSKDNECSDDNKHKDEYSDMKPSSPSKVKEFESSHDTEHKFGYKSNKNNDKDRVEGKHDDMKDQARHNFKDEDKHSSLQEKDKDRKLEGYITEKQALKERSKSRIIYLRNFHNWIKSMLINEYLTKVKDKKEYNEPTRVHDMCCGKGGDILKWWNNNITHLICSDISSVALEHCKTRYHDMMKKRVRPHSCQSIYTIEYITADCSKVRLREKYVDASMKLDVVSCQFTFHYSFESLSQAECMMRNAAECLQPGGYFIGTIPDSNELLARVRKSDTNSFGNDIYNIIFECDTTTPPLFGAKYNFYLDGSSDGSVDCSEFLVYFPLLVKLAKKYGLKLVKKEKFGEFYERVKAVDIDLQTKMRCLEIFPPLQGVELFGNADNDYEHAELFIESQSRNIHVGTLSKPEWEVTSLYLTFAFEKVEGTWNADGAAVYDI